MLPAALADEGEVDEVRLSNIALAHDVQVVVHKTTSGIHAHHPQRKAALRVSRANKFMPQP